jgi:hypothetical protein
MTAQRLLLTGALTAVCALPAIADENTREPYRSRSAVVKIEALDPFTHVAAIPEGADISSIQFQGAKLVSVATQRKSTIDMAACEESAQRDPGGSMFCQNTQFESFVPAYQVTYSYRGQPLVSDEYGNRNFTFNIYFRADQLSPDLQRQLSRKMVKRDASALFELTTSRSLIQRSEIDAATSKICDRSVSDGSWTTTNPGCSDQINYRTMSIPSDYIMLKVEPVASALHARSAQ